MGEKIKNHMESVLDRTMTLDERKFSVLLFLLIIGFFYLLFMDFQGRDLNFMIVDLVKAIIYGVIGFNALNVIGEFLNKKNEFDKIKSGD